ncbi:MAG: DUF3850 domain-containing protein [Gammaproteobacteria bacterium]|nr:DUF3850 domain-containing protein [Gammaproteobacteria bacterium]
MEQHELKKDPQVFSDSWAGLKTFEIRLNDRDYRIGDVLILKETASTGEEMKNGAPLEYTGRQLTRRVDYILDGYGLNEGWVIMSTSAI